MITGAQPFFDIFVDLFSITVKTNSQGSAAAVMITHLPKGTLCGFVPGGRPIMFMIKGITVAKGQFIIYSLSNDDQFP